MDQFYQKQIRSNSYEEEGSSYLKNYHEDTFRQLDEYKKINKDLVYMEIGCGQMFLDQELALQSRLVIGIDFCPSVLKIAKKMMDKGGIKNYLLIQGDILSMPIKDDKIDLIYGGGVIKHFKNTQQCVNELYKSFKKRGGEF